MSVAAVGGLVVAGAGMVASSSAANKAAGAQRDANGKAYAMDQANLSFQKKQYERQMEDVGALEDIFGPVRENLGNYYKNMSPERYQMQGKEQLEKQYQRTNDNIDAMFSNNGMYGSGQMASAKVAMEAQREEALASNNQNAMNQYNQEQQQWLQFGVNEINQNKGFAAGTQAGISNAFGQASNNIMAGGNAMANIGMQQAQGWGQMATGGMQIAGYGMGGGFGGKTSLGGAHSSPTLQQNSNGSYSTPGL